MAYTKTLWKDRIVQFAHRFTKSNETPTSVTLTADPGTITEPGTPFSSAYLNNIEQGLADAHETFLIKSDTNQEVLTYTSGNLTKVEEKTADGLTILKTTTLTYDGSGVLTTVTEVAAGKTVTTTLNYTSGNLTSTTKAVT